MFASLYILLQKNENRYIKNMTPSLDYFFSADETERIWNNYLLQQLVY